MSSDLFYTSTNLHWYRHDGWQTGTTQWEPPKVVSSADWEDHSFVFGGQQGVIYTVDPDGNLHWRRNDGWKDGSSDWTSPNGEIVHWTGWNSFKLVFTGGDGVIYAIEQSGRLRWYRHIGWQTGSPDWDNDGKAKIVSAGNWSDYEFVFAAGQGIIYAVDSAGNLKWFRHEGWRDGSDRWGGGSGAVIAYENWNEFSCVLAGGEGVIYAVRESGDLCWYRHTGWQTGEPNSWQNGGVAKVVGTGWHVFQTLFATFDGEIYAVGVGTKSWMSLIAPSRKLHQFTLPGTHDSGTWPFNAGSNPNCQSMTLEQQLNAGIRFIDIRVKQDLRNGKHDFGLYHGSSNLNWSGLWFSTDIVDICKKFLRDHPSETIVMCVKDEWGSTDDFEPRLKLYLTPDICLLGTTVPTLGAARGRIVLFRRYEYDTTGTPAKNGIPAHVGWPADTENDNAFSVKDADGNSVQVHVQDVYKFGGATDKAGKLQRKWNDFVKSYLEASKSYPLRARNQWWINFSSASGDPTIINPIDFAKGNWGDVGVNKNMYDYLAANTHGNFGTVVMDFPEYPSDGELIKRLIRANVLT